MPTFSVSHLFCSFDYYLFMLSCILFMKYFDIDCIFSYINHDGENNYDVFTIYLWEIYYLFHSVEFFSIIVCHIFFGSYFFKSKKVILVSSKTIVYIKFTHSSSLILHMYVTCFCIYFYWNFLSIVICIFNFVYILFSR